MNLMNQAEPRRRRNAAQATLAVLLGLGCVAIGLFFLYHTCWPVWEWFDSRHWHQATAVIHKVRLDTTGGSSPAYEVFCRYTYTYDGRSYTNNRVGLGYVWGQRNLWHQQAYRHLKKANQQGDSVPCFVDPDNPQQAVLFRDLEALALLYPAVPAAVLLLTGFLLLTSGRRRSKTMRLATTDAQAHASSNAPNDLPNLQPTATIAQTPEMLADATGPLTPPPDQAHIQSYLDEWGNEWVRVSCWPGAMLGLSLWVLTLLCTAGVALLVVYAVQGLWLLAIPATILAIIALLLWRHALSLLGAYHLRLHAADLLIVREFLFFSRHRTLSLPYIRQVTYQWTATRGRTRYHAVRLSFLDGRTIKIADGIPGEQAARWLVGEIARHLPHA